MNWLWANVPLMVVFFAAIAGIPLRHPDAGSTTSTISSPAENVAILAALLPEAELVGVN